MSYDKYPMDCITHLSTGNSSQVTFVEIILRLKKTYKLTFLLTKKLYLPIQMFSSLFNNNFNNPLSMNVLC